MSRTVWLVVGGLVLVFLAWTSFMGFVNTRTTRVEISVAGTVDEVVIYKATHAETPVATVTTNGQDSTQTVELRNAEAYSFLTQSPPAQYYFVSRLGTETYQSDVICCETGFTLTQPLIDLRISGLKDWAQTPALLP